MRLACGYTIYSDNSLIRFSCFQSNTHDLWSWIYIFSFFLVYKQKSWKDGLGVEIIGPPGPDHHNYKRPCGFIPPSHDHDSYRTESLKLQFQHVYKPSYDLDKDRMWNSPRASNWVGKFEYASFTALMVLDSLLRPPYHVIVMPYLGTVVAQK